MPSGQAMSKSALQLQTLQALGPRGRGLTALTASLQSSVSFTGSSELVVSQYLQGEGGNFAIKFRLKVSFYL